MATKTITRRKSASAAARDESVEEPKASRSAKTSMARSMDNGIRKIDAELIHLFRDLSEPIARFGIFAIFFWFGILKVVGLSPASPLVEALFSQTVPYMQFSLFMVLFGLFEMLIGIMFLMRGFEREVIPLLFAHMFTTFMPLFLLPHVTWSGPFVPTLEGQYIIKNLVVIAAAVGIAAHLHPLPRRKY